MTKSSLVLYVLVGSVGCGGGGEADPSAELAEESVDSALTGQSEAAVVAELTEGITATTTTEAAAQVAAHTSFTPAACATKTTSGLTTTLVLASCTGSYGLVTISGTIAVTVTAATATSVSFTATASDLAVNGATLDLAVDAVYHSAGGTTTVDVASTSTGTGPLGHAVTHEGAYSASWDDTCAMVDGAWQSFGEGASRSLAVSLERCQTGCPTGTVTRTRLDGSTIAITFDGTATATWAGSRRGTGTIALTCTP